MTAASTPISRKRINIIATMRIWVSWQHTHTSVRYCEFILSTHAKLSKKSWQICPWHEIIISAHEPGIQPGGTWQRRRHTLKTGYCTKMKIISWNAQGKFREKFPEVRKLAGDIYVIQECENPLHCRNKVYREFAGGGLWWGDNPNKGLGIFVTPHIHITDNKWEPICLRQFACVRVNDDFDLLAVWAKIRYIEEYYIYHHLHAEKYHSRMIVMGDFNSNQQWDRKSGRGQRNHSSVVQMLANVELCSAYHHQQHEEQGQESTPTFFLHRHPDKPYHIDYAFVAPERIRDCYIETSEKWLTLSDHRPLVLEIEPWT